MQKSRTKLFVENFIVYGIGGAINKIIPFVMIIIITRIIPNSSYIGIAENTATVVQFTFQIAILGVYDAMFRYFFEDESAEYQRRVTSSALHVVTLGGIVVSSLMILLRKQFSQLVYADPQYAHIIVIAAINSFMFAIGNILATPTRMRNQKKRYILLNALVPLISYGLSVPLILMGWYAIAMPLAAMVSSAVKALLFYLYNRADFTLKDIDRDMEIRLLKLGIPVMPSFVFYWIINSSQRIIITNYISLEAAGIYATGAKLAQVSQLIYLAFTTGWQYFAFSTMKNADHKRLISKTSEYLGGISFFASCAVVLLSEFVVRLLFKPEYQQSAIVLPALFLAPLIQMLYQSISSQFLVIKKTGYGLICLASGSIVALGLEFALLPVLGMAGPAIAALVGFLTAYAIMVLLLRHYDLIYFYPRTAISGGLAIATVFAYTFGAPKVVYMPAAAVSAVIIALLFYKDGIIMLKKLFGK